MREGGPPPKAVGGEDLPKPLCSCFVRILPDAIFRGRELRRHAPLPGDCSGLTRVPAHPFRARAGFACAASAREQPRPRQARQRTLCRPGIDQKRMALDQTLFPILEAAIPVLIHLLHQHAPPRRTPEQPGLRSAPQRRHGLRPHTGHSLPSGSRGARPSGARRCSVSAAAPQSPRRRRHRRAAGRPRGRSSSHPPSAGPRSPGASGLRRSCCWRRRKIVEGERANSAAISGTLQPMRKASRIRRRARSLSGRGRRTARGRVGVEVVSGFVMRRLYPRSGPCRIGRPDSPVAAGRAYCAGPDLRAADAPIPPAPSGPRPGTGLTRPQDRLSMPRFPPQKAPRLP